MEYLKKKRQADLASRKLEESKTLLGIQLTYESGKKDRQITLLSQQSKLNEIRVRQNNYILYGLIGLVIVVGILAFLFINQNKLKGKQRNTLLEQKLLRSQMNPHFIFNALSNISNLIDKKDNRTASVYLNKFARLMRHILESTRSDFIELDEEIASLENYLALQKLRFDKKFDYKIEVDEDIDAKEVSIPSMLIQPFVENSIEHGIKPKETIGHIRVRLKREDGFLNCEIHDDGIGRKKSMELRPKTHRSLATSITKERLEALNRKLRNKVTLEITDLISESGKALGTKVRIGIPIFV
jgi:LytS/YehU family sensor histidine kinase